MAVRRNLAELYKFTSGLEEALFILVHNYCSRHFQLLQNAPMKNRSPKQKIFKGFKASIVAVGYRNLPHLSG